MTEGRRTKLKASAGSIAVLTLNLIIPPRDGFKSFEEVWGSYESLLPEAICELVGSAGSMAAELWLLALVPFVGGLFARGPDFEQARATAT